MKKRAKNVVLVYVLIVIVASIFLIEYSLRSDVKPVEKEEKVVDSSKYPKAPEIGGIFNWINSEPLKIEELKGKVVLIDFWTYSCINCIRTFPYLRDWYEKYNDKGLVMIGIHTPEFNFEKKIENVERAVDEFDVKWAVAMDNDYVTWRNFRNNWWPRKFLIDKDGRIRYDHIGEGAYKETEEQIVKLLNELGKEVEMEESEIEAEKQGLIGRAFITPELYAGYQFARVDLGNENGYKPEQIVSYTRPETLSAHRIYVVGNWYNDGDNLKHAGEEGSILLKYTARSLNLVMGSFDNNPYEADVFLNGEYLDETNKGKDVKIEDGKSYVVVSGPKLYNLIGTQSKYGTHTLEVKTNSDQFAFYAFTFGS